MIACDDPETFGLRYYDVNSTGEWHPVDTDADLSSALVESMLGCGSPRMPWTSSGRALPAALAEDGWSDAFMLADEPGGDFPIPGRRVCTD
ncbi:hypothetical protein [Cellulomonas sp.]|uniref:hypothetical protein n=1 Tax=Cellulomonas sp. TaxID=40001 RepID=UPI001B11A332|nr:hypothetical protein [Cellulomonas sp.]MBO9553022.1 hypothetical protein [Cellulomonas sp.]